MMNRTEGTSGSFRRPPTGAPPDASSLRPERAGTEPRSRASRRADGTLPTWPPQTRQDASSRMASPRAATDPRARAEERRGQVAFGGQRPEPTGAERSVALSENNPADRLAELDSRIAGLMMLDRVFAIGVDEYEGLESDDRLRVQRALSELDAEQARDSRLKGLNQRSDIALLLEKHRTAQDRIMAELRGIDDAEQRDRGEPKFKQFDKIYVEGYGNTIWTVLRVDEGSGTYILFDNEAAPHGMSASRIVEEINKGKAEHQPGTYFRDRLLGFVMSWEELEKKASLQ